MHGQLEAVRLLLDRGASVDKGQVRTLAFGCCVGRGWDEAVLFVASQSILTLRLVDFGHVCAFGRVGRNAASPTHVCVLPSHWSSAWFGS